MRRSRRLSNLPPDVVKQKPARKNSKRKATNSAKKRSTTSSSSKKENKPPASRSARQTSRSVTRTKRKSTPAKSRSRKRATPKTSKTPKQQKKATTRSRSRRESAPSATTPRRRTPKQTRSRSAKRTTPKQRGSSKKSTKEASGIHRKTPRRTPATRSSRRAVMENALNNIEPTEKIPFVVDDEEADENYSPEMDEMLEPSTAKPTHSLDLTVLGIVICLTALYMFSFCRAMSCSAITKMPFLSSVLTDFDEGATAVTSFLLYVAAVMYCRSWLRKDGFQPVEENAFITLHFVHGLLLVVHLLSCSVFNPNEKQSNCIKSIVALSFGFYAAAWVAQLKFTLQFMRNSLTLCYMCVFYYNGKNTFGLVLLLAAKSVFWMTGAHMMNIVTDERWSLIDLVTTVGCVFMAYVVPSRV